MGRVMELLEDCMREAVERVGGFMTMVETCLMMILTEVARELTRTNKVSYTVREKIPIDVVRMQHVQHILDAERNDANIGGCSGADAVSEHEAVAKNCAQTEWNDVT